MAGEPQAASRNKRSEPRWRTLLQSGRILDGRNRFFIDCQVHDRSAHGARLRLTANVALPSRFRFFDPVTSKLFEAQVAWQRSQDVGVRFSAEIDQRCLTKAQLAALGIRSEG